MSKNTVPEWGFQVTERLLTDNNKPQSSVLDKNKAQISPLPPSAIIVESEKNKDEQFQDYIDRHFTDTDAKILKNRISSTSKATTLRNSNSPVIFDLEQAEKQIEDKNVWWISPTDEDGFYSVCALLFLFGFIFPPLWWIGSFWPKQVKEKGGKMADRWQKLNRIMSIGFSTILIITIIVLVILYTKN